MTEKTKLADKIRALFAKARHELTGEAEARAFEAKANDLMAKHMIEMAEITGRVDGHEFVGRLYYHGPTGPRGVRLSALMGSIARPHGVHHMVTSMTWGFKVPASWNLVESGEVVKKGRYSLLYGRAEIVEGVIALFERLSIDALAGASDVKGYDAADTKRMRNNFLDSYGDAVEGRLMKLNRARDEETEGRFLPVLRSDRERAAEIAPNGSRGSGYSSWGGGHAEGAAAGGRANLAGRSMPNARRALNA